MYVYQRCCFGFCLYVRHVTKGRIEPKMWRFCSMVGSGPMVSKEPSTWCVRASHKATFASLYTALSRSIEWRESTRREFYPSNPQLFQSTAPTSFASEVVHSRRNRFTSPLRSTSSLPSPPRCPGVGSLEALVAAVLAVGASEALSATGAASASLLGESGLCSDTPGPSQCLKQQI